MSIVNWGKVVEKRDRESEKKRRQRQANEFIHSKWLNKISEQNEQKKKKKEIKKFILMCMATACMSVFLQCENVTAEYEMCKDKGIFD